MACSCRERQRYTKNEFDGNQESGYSEEEVFDNLVESGGLVSVSQYVKDNTYLNENFIQWLSKRRNQISVYKRHGTPLCIAPFEKNATICFEHSDGECTRLNCRHFHICKFYLNGVCRYGRRCYKSHGFFDDHNKQIIENLALDNFSEKEIRTIILCRYPQVCRNESCSLGEDCPYLHICYDFINNKCDDFGCERGHSFETPHNKWVLKVYKMDRWPKEKIVSMKVILNMPKTQNRIHYSSHSTQYGYDIQSDDLAYKEGMVEMTSKRKQRSASTVVPSEKYSFPTFSTETDDDADKKNICLGQLVGDCQRKNCDGHHIRLPYLWQIHIFGKWISFGDEENQTVEQRYCSLEKTANGQVILNGNIYQIDIKFEEGYGTIVPKSRSISGRLNVRRLSTVSFATENTPVQRGSFHTQWRWHFLNDHKQWVLFDKDELQYTLERKYIAGQKSYLFTRKSNRFKYRINFPHSKQANLDSNTVRDIIRRPLFVPIADVCFQRYPQTLRVLFSDPHPPEWNALDMAHEFELIELEEKLPEFDGVKSAFFATLDQKIFNICNIYRIQNLALWNEFNMKKVNLEKTHAKKAGRLEERRLFHGTDSYDTCFGICTNNFDFRLSGKNATVFGKGSYFAVSAKYSHNYTKGPIHLMFQARVLIGSFAKGREDMTCPPIIKGAGHRRYDSCVDNTTCPSIFVIFDRNQCYPEYLIAYKDNCSMCEENRKNSNKRTPIGFGYNQKSYI